MTPVTCGLIWGYAGISAPGISDAGRPAIEVTIANIAVSRVGCWLYEYGSGEYSPESAIGAGAAVAAAANAMAIAAMVCIFKWKKMKIAVGTENERGVNAL